MLTTPLCVLAFGAKDAIGILLPLLCAGDAFSLYRALRGLSGVSASLVQLSTPVLAGLGGILLLSEPLSSRLVVASVLVLGGIALAVATRRKEAT